ncbi:MAG TPA: DEAD/DEAH box helicase [Verrucomicrobia bacterium]|nr:MAG: DEAD/DEAH box helicase [Lentisphaerae bacterium GWF2_57_35]HBA84420.1 DEAD/DEAH box helicase [Verrucomicrobiota bacterium]
MSFTTLGLREELLKAIKELGFEKPMPIQQKGIPPLLKGEQDFIGLAQTGTGKTGAYGLALLQRLDLDNPKPQVAVICPTRELCLQIADDLRGFAKHLPRVTVVPIYGGASIVQQLHQLHRGAQIVVATPGRLLDMIKRKAANLSKVSCVVLDEADEMLNMGFKEDLDAILESMPKEKRTWLFSATMARGVAEIAKHYLSNPLEVTVGGKNQSAENITHVCHVLHEKHRYQGLKRIIDFAPEIYGLVFCRTRSETQAVAEDLMQDGYLAETLHGDLSQAQRDSVMRKFRQKTIRILVATDVAARGLDVDDITHVIHYRLPDDAAIYTHRSGRTARAGKSGMSIALVNLREIYRINEMEKRSNIVFQRRKIPNGKAICEKQLFSLVEKIVQTDAGSAEIEEYLPAVMETLSAFDKKDLIKRFVSAEFTRFLDYYRHAGDINVDFRSERSDRGDRSDSPRYPSRNERSYSSARPPARSHRAPESENSQRFMLRFSGRMNHVNKGAIIRMVCEKSGIASQLITGMDLQQDHALFSVDKRVATQVLKSVQHAKLDGKTVQIEAVMDEKASHKRHPRD